MPDGPRQPNRWRAARAQDVPPEVAYWAKRQALRPLRLLLSVLLGGVFVFCMGWLAHALDEPTQFDRSLQAVIQEQHPQPWAPSYAMERPVIDQIDFEDVHARLLPEWVIALHHDPYSLGQDREHRRFQALMLQAGQDANLGTLLRRLRDRATLGVSQYVVEIGFLLDGWNAYMQNAGLPWYVAYDLIDTARGGRMYVRTYRIQADVSANVSSVPHHVRLLYRADSTNVGELFFGQTNVEERRAMVIADRVSEFALDRVWPLMDRESEERLSSMDRVFAPALRREAKNVLSSESMEALERGAMIRRTLVDRLNEVAARKGCGRGIEVENMPWNGLTPRGRGIVKRAVQYNVKKRCARLTEEDAEVLIGASDALSEDDGLRRALGELSSWVARAVAVHEVRHLADGEPTGASLVCDGCPREMSERGRAEVSAYVASLATEQVGYIALYQACGVDLPLLHDSGGAVRFLVGVLLPEGCDTSPPSNLYAQARLLEWILFKRGERVELPADFPKELLLPEVQPRMPTPGFEAIAEGPLRARSGDPSLYPMRSL